MNERDIYQYAMDRLAAGADAERVIQELADADIDISRVRNIVGNASSAIIRRDYYEVLGVSRTASTQQIRLAYRQKALQYHPDRNVNPGAAERFKQINEIYQTLCDDKRRVEYDRSLSSSPPSYGQTQHTTKRSHTRRRQQKQTSYSVFEADDFIATWQKNLIFYSLMNEVLVEQLLAVEPGRLSRSDAIQMILRTYINRGGYQKEVRKALATCLLDKEMVRQMFIDVGPNRHFAGDVVEGMLNLIKQDEYVCRLVCKEYMAAGGGQKILTRRLVVELGLSQSEAKDIISDAVLSIQRKRCISLAFVVVMVVAIVLAILFAT